MPASENNRDIRPQAPCEPRQRDRTTNHWTRQKRDTDAQRVRNLRLERFFDRIHRTIQHTDLKTIFQKWGSETQETQRRPEWRALVARIKKNNLILHDGFRMVSSRRLPARVASRRFWVWRRKRIV